MNFIASWLSSLSGSGTNIIIYIAIVVMFLIGVAMCVAPVIETRGRLQKALRRLRRKERSNVWRDENFLGKGALLEQWSAYLKNLRFSDGVYHSAASVEDFINEETVIYGPGRAAFSDALPGLMTSLGFLGTLIGLSQGLSGFSMTDANAAQQSIMVLIPGMRYAFLTSIFGVVGSVLFTLVTRAVYGSAEHTIREFYAALGQYTGVHSVDALTQLATYQQEQTDILRTMAMDINGQLTENLRGIISETMEPMLTAMDEFMTVSTKEQMRFLDTIVSRFVEHMNAAMDGQFKALGESVSHCMGVQEEAMRALHTELRDTKGFIRDVGEMREVCDALGESLRNYMDELTDSRKKSDEAYRRVASTVEQMDIIARQQNQFMKSVSAMNSEVSRALDRVTGTVAALTKDMREENEVSAQSLREAVNGMREMAATLTQMQKQSMRVIEAELNSAMSEYRGYAQSFADNVREMSEGVAQMPKAVDETCEKFLDEIDRISRTLEDAQRALDDAVDKMYAHKG